MNLGKLSYFSRKIHKWLVLLILIIGTGQMTTGVILRYPTIFPFTLQSPARDIHFFLATWFSIVFGLQMITGLIMYATPWLIKRFQKPPQL